MIFVVKHPISSSKNLRPIEQNKPTNPKDITIY